MDEDDQVVSTLAVHFSNRLSDQVHIHQYPLLTRPLQAPPSAVTAGRKITARIKPEVRRIEVHVPADTRPDVWNVTRGRDLGFAQQEDDRERNQSKKLKDGDEESLSEVRMRSEEIVQKGTHMLGIVRDGQLHLHPISQTHQFRPSLTYLDVLSRKSKRRGAGADSDSDDGPPLDPDEPVPPPVVKKEKRVTGESREVQVSTRKTDDKGLQSAYAGLSAVRTDMLKAIRAEEDEGWQDIQFHDVTAIEAETAFEAVFSQTSEALHTKTDITMFLNGIQGLRQA
ncbi:DNA-directed RNA polymerase III subunit Rpc5 [Mycena floridula]|nr:DNA-directed RNA polymerase III subunit Rpc5 [Mycena floridula]